MTASQQIPFLVLAARSDDARGERLNFGAVALTGNGPVVRLHEGAVRRLRHLHPDYAAWDADTETESIGRLLAESEDPASTLRMLGLTDALAPVGMLQIHEGVSAENTLDLVIERLIAPPSATLSIPKKRKTSQSKLAVQLRTWLRASKVYSTNAEDLSKGRVVGNYPIAARDDLYADFAVMNGHLHVIETLDLRGISHLTSTVRGDAAVKGITLDEAKNAVDGRRIAVVSATDVGVARPAISMVSRYASDVFVLESPKDRQEFIDFLHHALHGKSLLDFDLSARRPEVAAE